MRGAWPPPRKRPGRLRRPVAVAADTRQAGSRRGPAGGPGVGLGLGTGFARDLAAAQVHPSSPETSEIAREHEATARGEAALEHGLGRAPSAAARHQHHQVGRGRRRISPPRPT